MIFSYLRRDYIHFTYYTQNYLTEKLLMIMMAKRPNKRYVEKLMSFIKKETNSEEKL